MKCKSCGGSLNAGTRFCGRCGATVGDTASDGIPCPLCGAVNQAGAKFCRQDGTPLVDAPVTLQDAGATFSQRRPVHAGTMETRGGGSTSRLWLTLGVLAVLAAAGGGYWYYKSRGASPQVVDTAPAPDAHTPETSAAPEPEGDVLEEPSAAKSDAPSPPPSQVVDLPRVSIGDRWVTEVVDHQDAKLNYRAERMVTDVSNDRIVTSVRTVGKDYIRSVEYNGQWALMATNLPSGSTTTYSPALPYLSFPLQPGKSWEARVVETDAEGKARVHEIRAVVIGSWETVQVPAGTFNALMVRLSDDISIDGVIVQQGQDISWYAPDVRRTVKTEESSFNPASGERRRRTVSLVEYSLQNSGDTRTSAPATATAVPPADVVIAGGCPGEGCQLGNWSAREAVAIYDRPNGRVSGQLPAGAAVTAIDAEVRASPRRAVVTRVYDTDQRQGIKVGSVVYVLYPLGEGAVAVWHEGKVKDGSIDLGLRFDTPIESKPLNWTWWVRVSLPDGATGWFKNPQGQLEGMDAFG